MAGENREDPLAYGDYHAGQGVEGNAGEEDYQGGERGLIGDTYRKLRSKYQPQQQDPNATHNVQPQAHDPNAPLQPTSGGGSRPTSSLGSSLFDKIHGAVHGLTSELNQRLAGRYNPTSQGDGSVGTQSNSQNRYGSFADQKGSNDVKWYVDGCSYMWAVSVALEQARESVWILDCK